MIDHRFDIAIIGAGPAGLMAALESARQGASTLVISDEPPGGLTLAAHRLDNLPGYPGGARPTDWVADFVAQVRQSGVRIMSGRVGIVDGSSGCWLVGTEQAGFMSSAVVVATGTRPARFPAGLPRSGMIHRDIRSLPANLTGKSVGVIGSGEAAIDSALSIHERGAGTTILVRGDQLHACAPLLTELGRTPVTVEFHRPVDRVRCCETCIQIHSPAFPDGRVFNHIVIAIGREPRLDEIVIPACPDYVPSSVAGTTPGLYFAGDLLRSRDRYVVSAMGDGQRTACLAISQLNSRSHA